MASGICEVKNGGAGPSAGNLLKLGLRANRRRQMVYIIGAAQGVLIGV
jgi:hypothetical protein